MTSNTGTPPLEATPIAGAGSTTNNNNNNNNNNNAFSTTPLPAAANSAASAGATTSSLPQRRTLEEDYTPRPSVPSPLNPDVRSTPKAQLADDMPQKRAKKESLKKRESKSAFGPDSNRGTPDPKSKQAHSQAQLQSHGQKKTQAPHADRPLRYKLPPAKPSDFDPPRGPVFTHHHAVPSLDGKEDIEFHETSDHVYNKKSYRYTPCIADPSFPSSLYYRQSEPEPHGPHLNFEDSATHMYFDKTGRQVTTDKGFRLTRANVAIREGRFYWEAKITRGIVKRNNNINSSNKSGDGTGAEVSHGHVRLGFARREAAVDAPVGFDCYSYGVRDKCGQKVYMSRPKELFPADDQMYEGDIIGLEVQLPSERLQKKVLSGQFNPAVDMAEGSHDGGSSRDNLFEAPNVVRDRIPIRFKAHIYFEQIDYHTTKELEDLMSTGLDNKSSSSGATNEKPHPNHPLHALRTLPGSHIKVYKNGKLMGTAFEDLLAFLPPASRPLALNGAREGLDDGMLGYYPAVSVFRGGAVEVNFGPDFWCPPAGHENPGGAGRLERDDEEGGKEKTKNENEDEDVDMADNAAPATSTAAPLLPVSDRYRDQIVEDIVHDIVDEVDFWMQDGAKVIDRHRQPQGGRESGGGGGIDDDLLKNELAAGGREEIREVVQDD